MQGKDLEEILLLAVLINFMVVKDIINIGMLLINLVNITKISKNSYRER